MIGSCACTVEATQNGIERYPVLGWCPAPFTWWHLGDPYPHPSGPSCSPHCCRMCVLLFSTAAGGDGPPSGPSGLDTYYNTFSYSASTAEPRPPLPEWMKWRSGNTVIDTFLDDVQDPTQSSASEPDFKASELPKTMDRFWEALQPFIDVIDACEDIMHYTRPRVTLCFLGYYVMLVWYGICIPGALMLVIGLLVKDWAEINGCARLASSATPCRSPTRSASPCPRHPPPAIAPLPSALVVRFIPRILLTPTGSCPPAVPTPARGLAAAGFRLTSGRHLDPNMLRVGMAEGNAVPTSPEPEGETAVIEVVQPQPQQQRARGGLLGGLVDFAIGK